MTEDLPSASDYSDLDSPVEDAAVLSVISRTDKAGLMRSDVSRARDKLSAKTRLGSARQVLDALDNEESGELSSQNLSTGSGSFTLTELCFSRGFEASDERKEG